MGSLRENTRASCEHLTVDGEEIEIVGQPVVQVETDECRSAGEKEPALVREDLRQYLALERRQIALALRHD